MIIFRYLAREVYASTIAVSIILLLILLSGHFAKLLSEAAAGRLDAGVLFSVIGFMSLRFLEIILSLGLFIGILFSYGRLYVESEMTVLSACGISEKTLLAYTVAIAVPVALIVGMISLYLAPVGYKATHKIVAEQRNRTDFETIQAARFNYTRGGRAISYADSVSEDKKMLNNVFMASMNDDSKDVQPEILISSSGETRLDQETGRKYLVLKQGVRYVGEPGQTDYEIIEFDEYLQLLPQPDYRLAKRKETEGMSLLQLFEDPSHEALVAIHWRFSLPVLVVIIAFLAVPLSRTQPRRGRYNKLIPAILVYVFYVFLLQAVRGEAEKGEVSPVSLWYVHVLFVLIGLTLFNWPSITRLFQRQKNNNPPALQSA